MSSPFLMSRGRALLASASLMLLGMGTSEATLIDRGGGLIYDDVLDVTWLQDAAYAQTGGYSASGLLNWTDAMQFASDLQFYDSARNVVWDDWRLPTAINDPSSLGYDLTGMNSELSYMYYVNLGYAPGYTHGRFDPAPTSSNYNPFINLETLAYWTGTTNDFGNRAYLLHFHFGSLEIDGIGESLRVWAVRDGDVANSVPEPGTLGLFGLSLMALNFASRKRLNHAANAA